MTHMRIKMLLAGTLLVGAVAYLAMTGVKSGWVYFMPVDQFLNEPQYRTQRVRLCGSVGEDGLEIDPGHLTASFQLHGEKSQVAVAYHGVIPEMFKAGGDVVAEGKLDAQGIFQADIVMTKCASKYDPKDGKMHPVTEGETSYSAAPTQNKSPASNSATSSIINQQSSISSPAPEAKP